MKTKSDVSDGRGSQAQTTPPHASEASPKFLLKQWGITGKALQALGVYFVEEELMHLSFNEHKLPERLKKLLPPLRVELNLHRAPGEPSAAQLQAEALNARMHMLRPGTLWSLDGALTLHVTDPDFPSTFDELVDRMGIRRTQP